jgi:hypothetical protein
MWCTRGSSMPSAASPSSASTAPPGLTHASSWYTPLPSLLPFLIMCIWWVKHLVGHCGNDRFFANLLIHIPKPSTLSASYHGGLRLLICTCSIDDMRACYLLNFAFGWIMMTCKWNVAPTNCLPNIFLFFCLIIRFRS